MGVVDGGGRSFLVVVTALEGDAPTRLTVPVVRELAARGNRVMVAAWHRGGVLEDELDGAGVAWAVAGRSFLKYRQLLREFGPDLAHFHLARPIMIALPLTRVLDRRVRTVITNHGLHELKERGALAALAAEPLFPRVAGMADRVIHVSRFERDALVKMGADPKRQRVIYNGVAPEFFDVRRDEAARGALVAEFFPGRDAGSVVLAGAAGNLRAIKDYGTLIRAMGMLPKGDRTVLVIWGDGPERGGLERQVAEAGLGERVRLAGRSDGMARVMGCLDVFVQPSRHESFGLSLAEALAAGVPAIASRGGAMPEIVPPDYGKFLFEPGNAAELCARLGMLRDSADARGRYGRTARKWAGKHFTQGRMVSETLACYDEALGGGRRG